MNIRAEAARLIKNVLVDKQPLHIPSLFKKKEDQAFLQTLCYGVCRWYFPLHEIAQSMLKKPLKEKDSDVYALILIGLLQLIHLRVPDHAAIGETVSAAVALKKPWAKGFINAVLREYQRHPKEAFSEEGVYSHPAWLIEKIKRAYPENWKTILIANNQHPPFSLRVNQKRITREAYLKKLMAANISATELPYTSHGIVCDKPIDATSLPGFLEGDVSVQEGAAQFAASLLQLEPEQRVLDACAAPGGKSAHILEQEPRVELLALDKNKNRLQSIEENLKRLRFSATCQTREAGNIATWWDKREFDRILLDAPCSATGIIRRHPDIKLLRFGSDISALAEKQYYLLSNLWTTLKTGGLLLYVTCSVLPEENSEIIQRFLASHSDAKEEKIQTQWGINCTVGKQILPGSEGMDGFYYVCLRKF